MTAGPTLRAPGVRCVAALYILARVPAAAVWLSIVLDVSGESGSYGRAGGAVAAYGVGVALLAPLLGRLADRFGARPVLLLCAAVQLPALLLLASAADADGLALLVPAFAAGAVQPPLVPCMRAGWALLVPDEGSRQACFAFDAVLGEVVDLAAPLLAVALNVSRGEAGSLQVVALAVAITTVLYSLVTPSRPGAAPAGPRGGRRVLTRPVLSVLAVVLVVTAALGAVEVAAIAFADGLGARSSAGVLLALFTLGSIGGGIVHGRRPWAAPPCQQLLVLLVPLFTGLAVTALLPHSLWVAGPLLALAGVAVAPLVAVLLGLLQATAQQGAATETFTYATTANFLGVAGGSVVAGTVGDLAGRGTWVSTATATMAVSAALTLLAAAVVVAVAPRLPTAGPEQADDRSEDREDDRAGELVAAIEQVWSATRAVGGRNDQLARQVAALRADRRAGPRDPTGAGAGTVLPRQHRS